MSKLISEITKEGKGVFAYLTEPYRDAEKLLTKSIDENGKIVEQDIYNVANQLLIRKFIKKIKNCESIINKAKLQFDRILNKASHNFSFTHPDSDWLDYFFDLASKVSNEAIQQLWARILVQEHTEKGFVKKILINTLALLDAESARCFQNLCSLTYQMKADEDIRTIPFVIYDNNIANLLEGYDGNIDSFQKYLDICPEEKELDYLAELGLITTTNLTESVYCIYSTEKTNVTFSCRGGEITIESPFNEESNMYQTEVSFVFFTNVGYSLYKILNVTEFDGLFEILKRFAENQINDSN